MADSKITALTALTAADPANDMIPIVDVSDTPPASGNTKRISINNILACSPSATLASATITGDLTVDTSTLKVDSTNNRVGIVQATPLYPLHLVGEFGLEEASAGNGSKLRMIGQSTKYNFRLGKQIAVDNAFEITPSTAVGGTTFSNPVYTVTYDGIHTFLDGAGGTRMTLNSTGLGVGASPTAKLHVQNSSLSGTTAGSNVIATLRSNGSGYDSFLQFSDNVAYNAGLGMVSGNLYFYTSGAERGRLDASGNLLVGTTTQPTGVTYSRATFKSTSADWASVVWNSNATPYGLRIQQDTDVNGTGNEFLICYGSTNIRASIRSNGGIANYSANNVSLSDARAKTDIKPLASYWNKIKSLELVTFKYKDQTHSDDNIGLIAQQVESVAPELVDADGFGETPADGVPLKTIYTTDLYHASIKALQEAMARIEALEAKLA